MAVRCLDGYTFENICLHCDKLVDKSEEKYQIAVYKLNKRVFCDVYCKIEFYTETLEKQEKCYFCRCVLVKTDILFMDKKTCESCSLAFENYFKLLSTLK